jgi:hypothetical protein
MSAEPPATAEDFHRGIAQELFDHVMALLAREDRTCAENDRMIHAAHASRFHWEFGGNPVNLGLGEWQCSRVHAVLRQPDCAIHHGWSYLEVAENYGLGPFHLAHAHLSLAAGFAIVNLAEAAHHRDLAREIGSHCTEEAEQTALKNELEAQEKAVAGATAPLGAASYQHFG